VFGHVAVKRLGGGAENSAFAHGEVLVVDAWREGENEAKRGGLMDSGLWHGTDPASWGEGSVAMAWMGGQLLGWA
jgi:hypothetical protein